MRQLSISGHTLLEPVVLPALPSGSTLTVTTAFLRGLSVEHRQMTPVKDLGRGSVRTLQVQVPAGLAPGSKATATLVAVTAGPPGVVITSTATINLRAR